MSLAQNIVDETVNIIIQRNKIDLNSPRECPHCKQVKPPIEYFKSKSRFDGYSVWCKDCLNDNVKRWKENNPERQKEMWRNDKRRRRSAITSSAPYLLMRAWKKRQDEFGHTCAYCGSNSTLTQDHVVAIGKDSNAGIVPACVQCNSSKRDRDMLTWYREQAFYSADRLKRIYATCM